MHNEIVRDENGNRRMVPETQFLICEHASYRGHSDVSGFTDDYNPEDERRERNQIVGVSITELEKPGVDKYVRTILRSAVLQCSGNPTYNAEVSAHRTRIAKLQRQEAQQADSQQQILNRKKKAVA